VKVPRITGITSEPPPFAGDVPATLGTLAPYTNADDAPGPPVVTPALAPPRLRQPLEIAPIVTLAALAVSAFALALALTVAVRQGRKPVVVAAPVDTPVAVIASGRDGPDRLNCMGDVVTVTVTRAAAGAGVMVGLVEAPDGTAQLVLRPAAGGYRGYIYVDKGVLRTEPRTRGINVWPDERIVLRVHGLPDARELRVGGRQALLGSRAEGPCT